MNHYYQLFYKTLNDQLLNLRVTPTRNVSLPYLAAALAGFFDLPAPVVERKNNSKHNEHICSFTCIIDFM